MQRNQEQNSVSKIPFVSLLDSIRSTTLSARVGPDQVRVWASPGPASSSGPAGPALLRCPHASRPLAAINSVAARPPCLHPSQEEKSRPHLHLPSPSSKPPRRAAPRLGLLLSLPLQPTSRAAAPRRLLPPSVSPLGRSFQGTRESRRRRRSRSGPTFKKGTIVDAMMESKGGKKSSSSNFMYEAPLGYKIEDVRPAGGIKKFQSAAYSNCARKPS